MGRINEIRSELDLIKNRIQKAEKGVSWDAVYLPQLRERALRLVNEYRNLGVVAIWKIDFEEGHLVLANLTRSDALLLADELFPDRKVKDINLISTRKYLEKI